MSEVKIARFVGIEACRSIFSENSTFVLRSPEHYRRLYEISNGTKGDRDEGVAKTTGGGTAEYTCFVASCWTKLKGSKPTSDEWDIFKKNDQNIVAIVSTPSKVCAFLDEALGTKKELTERRYPFYPVQHREVTYDEVSINCSNDWNVVPFCKDQQFVKEKEHRFVLEYLWPNIIDSFIFCGGIDYMEKCFADPGICQEQKKELRLIIMTAMAGYGDFTDKNMGDIIANAEEVFC